MAGVNAASPALAAPAGIALAVLGVATGALVLLGVGDAHSWFPHGDRPAGWSVMAWAALFLAGWTLMTGAMMLPSSVPFLDAVAQVGGARASRAAGAAFTGVWLLVGVLQWAALWLAGDLLAGLAPGQAALIAGASLIGAAGYQASPAAMTCQRACARPFSILARHWHGHPTRWSDAWAAGAHYGLSCVGCCLPMVVVMFIVGAHDLLWIVALALFMVAQKRVDWGRAASLAAAAAMATAGLAIAGGWWEPPLRNLRSICAS